MPWTELVVRVAKRHEDHAYVCQIEVDEREPGQPPLTIMMEAFRLDLPGQVPDAVRDQWVKTMLLQAAAAWELNRAIRAVPPEERGRVHPPLFGDAVV